MNRLMDYQWELFIAAEVLSWASLILFMLVRYAFNRQRLSVVFLLGFLILTIFEAVLAYAAYRQTGEISSFQIIVLVFIVYACTFGIADFKNLDRTIRKKVGSWRGVDLLTDHDRKMLSLRQSPRYKAKKARQWWYGHALVYLIGHFVFWSLYGQPGSSFTDWITDWSWWNEEENAVSPYINEGITRISRIWTLIFILDTIISWSYTLFPDKEKGEEN